MRTITIKNDGKQKTVAFDDCVKVMTKMLRDFGYDSLTEETVEHQIEAILQKKKLSVIGIMIQEYISVD